MQKLLEVSDLCVNYGGVQALREVSFDVNEGEIVSLIGANGAGKSSTLNAISAIVSSSGEIVFNGQNINVKTSHEIVRLGIAQVPEGRRVFPALTVADNLEMGGFIHKKRRTDYHQTLESVYVLFPRLKERSGQLAGTLSGGEQQMLALGRALMAKPKLMMLDEPSLGLAPVIIEEIFNTLVKIRKEGVSVLFVEQNARRALAISDRTYLLETGRVMMSGKSDELKSNPVIQEVYLGAVG